jgi:DNA-binding Lrp family transcriptional regulator
VAKTRGSELLAALHAFGLQRDRFRSAMSAATGLSLTAVDALEYLESLGPLTQRELGEHLLLTSGAVTMLVDRLERDGLVQRGAHPTDRRVTVVCLRPGAALPDVPEVEGYHRALALLAKRLSATEGAAAAAFLTAAAQEAGAAADAMSGRPRLKEGTAVGRRPGRR